eukprot:gnl/MRDRNA2_/MRDRNA2_135464_c0_seq1.p1 gnl/MRDRNA2_/MRDRNA2_135464_c0~~gnl/MRDRNA2_/MRDRNA2_135464_c0_seq1.p1  ORF type:complete len:133 (-),score=2.44 gnl/MRDRNA2_/MRDRNA2_135464_c0_seq1:27-425(-)
MDLGDIIYFVIIIIGLLSGLLQSRKKKEKSNKRQSTLDTILKEITGSTYPTQKENSYNPKASKVKKEDYPATEAKKKPGFSGIETSSTRVTDRARTKKKKTIYKDPIPPTEESDFDLKQAVIYSEILKRPDY